MTRPERTAALLTALHNAAPTQAQQQRILDAFMIAYAPDPSANPHQIFLRALIAYVRETVASVEVTAAQEQARRSITPPVFPDP